jgi:septal ring factor EnvC (AmiA/AmiB activator)
MKTTMLYVVLLVMVLPCIGQSREELEKQKAETIADIQKARDLLEQTARTRKNNLNRVNILNSGIQSRVELISVYEREINQLALDMEEIEVQIGKLQEQINTGKKEYVAIVRSVYFNHTNEDKMMYLLASESLNQFYQRVKYMKYLTNYRERKVKEIESLMVQLNQEKDKLNQARAEKLSMLEVKEEERRMLSREREQKRSLINRLAQDESRLRKELKEKQRIKDELESEIRRAIEEEARKSANNSIYGTLTPEQRLVGSNFSQNKGRLPWPVEKGIVTAKFGVIDHPVLKGVKINNNGVDITSTPGTKARAVFDGEVSRIFAILGANYTVIIMHGEYLSVYQNLVDLKVKAGDKVTAKQPIGTIYNDSEEGASILHFQVWKERDIQNPELWISK